MEAAGSARAAGVELQSDPETDVGGEREPQFMESEATDPPAAGCTGSGHAGSPRTRIPASLSQRTCR